MLRHIALSLLALALPFSLNAEEAQRRLVSAAGAITETIYALGAEKELVAADISSVYPEEATKLPQIGYARMLSAEGILSMRPTLLLLNEDAGPNETITQLESAGVAMLKLTNKHTPDAAAERILSIGKALEREPQALDLVKHLRAQLARVKEKVEATTERPKVLFIYTRGGALMNVAGKGSTAEAIIELAGGVNAVTEYEGYRPLTAEGAVTAAPDYLLITSRGLESSGGIDDLLKQPGLLLTPAGKARKVIAMDDLLLLGFGPRLGEAAEELFQKLHPDVKTETVATATAH